MVEPQATQTKPVDPDKFTIEKYIEDNGLPKCPQMEICDNHGEIMNFAHLETGRKACPECMQEPDMNKKDFMSIFKFSRGELCKWVTLHTRAAQA